MKHVTSKSQHDKLVVEAVVRQFGSVSRSEIHEFTNLQQSEISRLTRELLEEGRLVEAGRARNPMGRKQILLALNEDQRFVIGVGFDDENVLASTMNLRPTIKSELQERTKLNEGTEGLVSQLMACTRKAVEQAGVPPGRLAGIGLAGSGLIDSRRGMFLMSSTVDFLKDVPLQHLFEEEFGVPVVLENLTRAKTVGERLLGAGEMAEDMIFVEYGRTGIGAGVIIGGKLLHGSGFAAGEFGHTHMTEGGPACRCGSFGCLEALAGAGALAARMRKAVAEGSGSEVVARAGGDPEKITGWMILEAARDGDKTSALLLEHVEMFLGLGLANLVNLFNPSVLVLDQRLELAGSGTLEQIRRVVSRQALRHATEDLKIRFGRLGSEAVALGVGSIILQKQFEIPLLKPPRFMIDAVPSDGMTVRTGGKRPEIASLKRS